MLERLILIHKYVKEMKYKPQFGKPYDTYLYDMTQNIIEEGMGQVIDNEDRVWQLASFIAEKVESKLL